MRSSPVGDSITSTPPNLRFQLDQFGNTAVFYGIDPGQFVATATVTDQQGHTINFNVPLHVLDAPMPVRVAIVCASGEEKGMRVPQ